MSKTIGDKSYNYDIGGKRYIQRPLVLGQIRQLLDVLRDVVIPGNIDTLGLIDVLGDRLPLAFAIVLTEEGASPRKKDLPLLADEIEFAVEPQQAIQVIEDFLACNPLSSILERLAGLMTLIGGMMETPDGLRSFASSSETETSPGGNGSSGEQPLRTPEAGRKRS